MSIIPRRLVTALLQFQDFHLYLFVSESMIILKDSKKEKCKQTHHYKSDTEKLQSIRNLSKEMCYYLSWSSTAVKKQKSIGFIGSKFERN